MVLFFLLFLLFFVFCFLFSVFCGGYVVFPKGGYDKNYDFVIVERVFFKSTRGSEPGIEVYSLIEDKVLRYDNLIDKKFMIKIIKETRGDRKLGLYWYYKGLVGVLVNERGVLGYEYEGESINDIEGLYFSMKDRKFNVFKFGVGVLILFSSVSFFSVLFFLRKR